jgi:hypothetical protein
VSRRITAPSMIRYGIILTDDNGRELRYDRYAPTNSIHDRMMAHDSAVKAFIEARGKPPTSSRIGLSANDGEMFLL